MDNIKLLNDEELEKVAGGTGTSLTGNEAQAFQTASDKLQALYNQWYTLDNYKSRNEYQIFGYALPIIEALKGTCDQAITGEIPLDYALTALDSGIECGKQLLGEKHFSVASGIVNELKANLGC